MEKVETEKEVYEKNLRQYKESLNRKEAARKVKKSVSCRCDECGEDGDGVGGVVFYKMSGAFGHTSILCDNCFDDWVFDDHSDFVVEQECEKVIKQEQDF